MFTKAKCVCMICEIKGNILRIRLSRSITKRLVTNYGRGVYKMGVGKHVKFYPYERREGGEKKISYAEGGHKNCWGSFHMVPSSFSHIEVRGAQKVSTL